MSISTCSISSYRSSEASLGSEEGWKGEISDKVNIFSGTLDAYVETFVPSPTPCTLEPPEAQIAEGYNPQKGKELEMYAPVIEILNHLVANFPRKKRLSFYDHHGQTIAFPFSAFSSNHHCAKPDIAVSFPGESLPDKIVAPDWSRWSMIIEAKATAAEDPFLKGRGNSLKDAETLIQLAVNARGLLFAHGFLATFVLGLYGDTVRIARFDHACVVVSPPFSLKSAHGLKVIRDFFWRFVHPWERVGPRAIVGCDTTIRKLSSTDEAWLIEQLGDEAQDLLEGVDLSDARVAKVYDDDKPETPKTFILFNLIDVNARLFSRATMVWLAIEDTRANAEQNLGEETKARGRRDSKGKRKAADKENPQTVLRIVKESWRQLVRIPEPVFYRRLKETIPEQEWVGLPGFVCGGDLGARDVKRWQAACSGQRWNGDDELPTGLLSTSGSSSSEPSTVPSSLASEGPSSSETGIDVDPKPPTPEGSASPRLLPYPMHQTWSFRLSKGNTYKVQERSHMRFAVDTVGRPLSRFKNTKELVMALRDAIRGHQLARERGGLLHRDVSSGNILIVDRPVCGRSSTGILHDYDYSSMTLVPPGSPNRDVEQADATHPPQLYPLELSNEFENVARCKERTGTYYFMSIELLKPRGSTVLLHDTPQDLESFYWVLIWIVLRHTPHNNHEGDGACDAVFKYGSDSDAMNAKRSWLHETVQVAENQPLSDLINDFSDLVMSSIARRNAIPLTYEAVLKVFDKALDRNDWPEADAALPFIPPDTRTRSVFPGNLKSGVPITDATQEYAGEEEREFGPGLISGTAGIDSRTSKRRKRSESPVPAAGGSGRVRRPRTERAVVSCPERVPSHAPRRGNRSKRSRAATSGNRGASGGRRGRGSGSKKASGA